MKGLTEKAINTVRILSADAVQRANSGHPGTPMALAPLGHLLWSEFMKYNPENPQWPNRDRFVLSCGHACMLQYSYLYLTGFGISLDDIKNFRQLNSITPGHPEYGLTPGVEVTTGPLGQGFANGVGMGIAQKYLAEKYNNSDFEIFDYSIYCICSDGDLMEGVTAESASLAGYLKLDNLIYYYDSNNITIEGNTDLTFDEDVQKRFESYGWYVQHVKNINDLDALREATKNARNQKFKPSLIIVNSHIGYGSPAKQDTPDAHGSPLGEEEVRKVKENFGFDPDKKFDISEDVLEFYRNAAEKSSKNEIKWNNLYKSYKEKFPELAKEYESISSGNFNSVWEEKLPKFKPGEKMATRNASGKTLNAISEYLPQLIGGSADLAPSTNTFLNDYDSFSAENYAGRNFHFGIREHAMTAVLNGMALSNYLIPYGATFLIFSDYLRPSLRLAAIMKIKTILVFTHDSIGLGEDGTTHQPIEQLIGLRSVPNVTVIRPADANETAQAWKLAINHKSGPVCLILTRQGIPILDQEKYAKAENIEKGAYVLSDCEKTPEIILIASGSEVHLILEVQKRLNEENISARVVSMPSWNLFEMQSLEYKNKVLPPEIKKRLAVEAASPFGWEKYTTDEGYILGIDKFGESAPGDELMKEYGFTVENILEKVKKLLNN